jgi:hypothetical protein
METAIVVLCTLNLAISGAALIQAHRAFQAFSTVVQLLRAARQRGR